MVPGLRIAERRIRGGVPTQRTDRATELGDAAPEIYLNSFRIRDTDKRTTNYPTNAPRQQCFNGLNVLRAEQLFEHCLQIIIRIQSIGFNFLDQSIKGGYATIQVVNDTDNSNRLIKVLQM